MIFHMIIIRFYSFYNIVIIVFLESCFANSGYIKKVLKQMTRKLFLLPLTCHQQKSFLFISHEASNKTKQKVMGEI